jgi:aspartyl-tRNA(Asn)/glutamyl-tRNA(Gln) amidotransferase subunit C
MSIERDDLEKVAGLARLQLSRDEAERLTRDCRSILRYFQAARDADVAGTRPLGALEHAAPLREDRVDSEPLDRALDEIAPVWRDGYFILPRLPAMDAGAADGDADE